MKKNHFLLLVVALMILAALVLRIIENKGKWVCQDGRWVKQGRTTALRPINPCPSEAISEEEDEQPVEVDEDLEAVVKIVQPLPGEILSSPYEVRGWAPGTWFFEANLPIKLLDQDGQTVAITGAMTAEDWMTKELVPFSGILEFNDLEGRGELVIMKDNPSALPEFDDEVRLPIRFSAD